MALPVFKTGCCPLAGQAGFDSQALPPAFVHKSTRVQSTEVQKHAGSKARGFKARGFKGTAGSLRAGRRAYGDAAYQRPADHDETIAFDREEWDAR